MTCPWARCTTARPSRRSTSTWPTSKSTSRGRQVFLDVRDPKFSGSFIEKGDSVLFSRDKRRIRHIIQDIVPAHADDADACAYRRRRPIRSGIGEQTQVIFLKRQEYRTDLFGVGAIAFDLISCGKSSERFYESIRRFEFDGNGRGSVESTIGKYRRVKDGLADEPELVHIFEPFRHGSDYAPEAFVELILRCMLYKADKTFYAPYEDAACPPRSRSTARRTSRIPEARPSRDALAYIDTELDYKNNSFALDNPLVTLKPPTPPTTRVDRLDTIINRLQQPDYDWKLRLARRRLLLRKARHAGAGPDEGQGSPVPVSDAPGRHSLAARERTVAVPVCLFGVYQPARLRERPGRGRHGQDAQDRHPSVRAASGRIRAAGSHVDAVRRSAGSVPVRRRPLRPQVSRRRLDGEQGAARRLDRLAHAG